MASCFFSKKSVYIRFQLTKLLFHSTCILFLRICENICFFQYFIYLLFINTFIYYSQDVEVKLLLREQLNHQLVLIDCMVFLGTHAIQTAHGLFELHQNKLYSLCMFKYAIGFFFFLLKKS